MKYSISALILLAGFSSTVALQAGSLAAPCTTQTLATYETYNSQNKACSVGIENFSDFTFDSAGTGTLLGDASIIVTPGANTTDVGGGFTFSVANPNNLNPPPVFTVGAGLTAFYYIDWYFVIDPGPVGSGGDLGMDPPTGNVSIDQSFCFDSNFYFSEVNGNASCSNQSPVQTLHVDDTNPPTSWHDHKDFNPAAQNYGYVDTTISLNGTNQTGASGFDNFTSTDMVTPEPSTIALAFGGILAFAARRRLKPLS